MAEGFESDPGLRMGVAAALYRSYSDDLSAFLPFLAQMLQNALPADTEVQYRGVFKKQLSSVRVQVGANRFAFASSGSGGIQAAKTHVVRGIALKTEDVSIEEAIRELAEWLEAGAQKNATAKAALGKVLGLD